MHKRLEIFVEVNFVVADGINVWIQGIVNISKIFSTKIYGNSYPEFLFLLNDYWIIENFQETKNKY